MTESDLSRLVLQGGSFAVLCFLAVWVVRYGIPHILSTFERVAAQQSEAARQMQETYIASVREIKDAAVQARSEYRADLDRTHERFVEAIAKNTGAIEALEAALRDSAAMRGRQG